MELVNAVDREVARVFAAASAISQAVCFFRMKATALIAETTGTGVAADICVM
jgi:hypothetical protein